MRETSLNYYPHFSCKAGACHHSCCIGWEIDIDDETLALYEKMPGELGARVRAGLTTSEGCVCFRLEEGERCPHLNAYGLCDIILEAGEGYLSQICDDHPRYRSYFSDHAEIGVGLACEAAASLVLGWEQKAEDIVLADDGGREMCSAWEETLLQTRARYIAMAQNRNLPLNLRVKQLEQEASLPPFDPVAWAKHLRGLERLDDAWSSLLDEWEQFYAAPIKQGSALFNQTTEIALEQFLVYLFHRHFANAETAQDLPAYTAFCVWGYHTLASLVACQMAKDGAVTFAGLCECARLWSSEIEYSTENVEACLSYLAERT